MRFLGFSIKKINKPKIKKRFSSTANASYEAASTKARLKNWRPTEASANSVILNSLPRLRSRARDMVRNNPLAKKAVESLTDNVVGHGTMVIFKNDTGERVQKAWNDWVKSTDIDFDNMFSFTSMQEMIVRAVIEGGECLVRKRINSKKDIPLEYQILEGEFFSTIQASDKGNKNSIIQGIEIDSDGRVVKYHIYKDHPGDYYGFGHYGSSINSINTGSYKVDTYTPKEMYHIFNKTRAGQLRGVPFMAPAMVRLKDTDDFLDATIMKQKVSACFAAFVHDLGPDTISEEAYSQEDAVLAERLEPATIEQLPSGKDIKFTDPPDTENFKEFNSVMDRNVANGLGLSYEALTGDLSGVNFSSARMGWLEMNRHVVKIRKKILLDCFLSKVVKDFLEVYRLKSGSQLTKIDWDFIEPKREMIDPVKETAALKDAVRCGFISQSEAIMSLGRNPEKVFEQISLDNKKLDALGLKLDSDPRNEIKSAAAGGIKIEEEDEKPPVKK